MKKIILALVVLFATIAVNAQLTNTKWKGSLPTDTPMDVTLDFKKDTVLVYNLQDNSVLETMAYTATDTTLTLQKLWGQSDCNSQSKGQYRFDIKEGVLSLKTIMDDCDSRSYYLNNSKWTKLL